MSELGELIYFPVMAKGLQLAICAEMSGLPWSGFTTEEAGPKSWGELKPSGIAPFGQMPLLKTPGGMVIGQAVAIANYIAKKAGAVLEGESDEEFAVSQMCMQEGEDIYSMLGKCHLANWKTVEQRAEGAEDAKALFADGLAAHFANLDGLCKGEQNESDGKWKNCKFTSTGTTAGELYLWGMIHQSVLAGGTMALNKSRSARGGAMELYYPKLNKWYNTLLEMDGIKKVLAGESAIGTFNVYFIDTPTFNKKHGIEDDSGYGEANGYGTVAVDLAEEARKAKATMKALRASQMDKPPPVAMKLNKETGEMEKFVSSALTDDFAEVEDAGAVEFDLGDDY